MARYEDARIAYKKAVLASLHGASNGESIRQAIVKFQEASAELKRLQDAPAPVLANDEAETSAFPGWQLFRRLLKAS
jgi:hypothetical protein